MNFSRKNNKHYQSNISFVNKKILSTIFVIVLTFITVNAQVKPKVSVKTSKVKTGKAIQSLKVMSLDKLKSVEDLKRLNIPVAKVTKEKLRAKPTRTWKINPQRLNDGFLRFETMQGTFDKDRWTWGSNVDRHLQNSLDRLNEGKQKNDRYDAFPFKIKFRVTGGVEYRIKIRQLYILPESRSHYIYVAIKSMSNKQQSISKINNENNVFNYIFKRPRSEEVIISLSGIPTITSTFNDGRGYWQPINVAEVRIDRIN